MTGFGTATIDLDLLFWSAYSAMFAGIIVWFFVRIYYRNYTRAIRHELDYQLLDESILTRTEFDKRKEALRKGLDDWLEDYDYTEKKVLREKPQ